MKQNTTLKIVGTVALVGTLAVVGVLNTNMPGKDASTFLASQGDANAPQLTAAFTDYISRFHKSYLTADEFKARLSIF